MMQILSVIFLVLIAALFIFVIGSTIHGIKGEIEYQKWARSNRKGQ